MARTVLRFRVLPPSSGWSPSDFNTKGKLSKSGERLFFPSGTVHEVDVSGNAPLKRAIVDAVAAGVGVELVKE